MIQHVEAPTRQSFPFEVAFKVIKEYSGKLEARLEGESLSYCLTLCHPIVGGFCVNSRDAAFQCHRQPNLVVCVTTPTFAGCFYRLNENLSKHLSTLLSRGIQIQFTQYPPSGINRIFLILIRAKNPLLGLLPNLIETWVILLNVKQPKHDPNINLLRGGKKKEDIIVSSAILL